MNERVLMVGVGERRVREMEVWEILELLRIGIGIETGVSGEGCKEGIEMELEGGEAIVGEMNGEFEMRRIEEELRLIESGFRGIKLG